MIMLIRVSGIIELEFVQLRLLETFASENERLDPVRHDLLKLVLHMRTGRDSKDVIKFFKGALFRLY